MCRTPVARVTIAATAGATYPQGSQTSERIAWKRHLCSIDMALVTSMRMDDLIIFYFMSFTSYLPNLDSLSHPNGLEEAHVAH